MKRFLIIGLALWCAAATAHAETAFIMTPHVETDRIAADMQAQAIRATVAALRAQGVTVISLEDARKKGAECDDETCIVTALDKLHADFGVQATMMTTPGGDPDMLGSIGVAFYLRDMVYSAGSVRVLDGGVDRAVNEGILTARSLQRRGPGPWVVIDGSPPDVELLIDGERVDDGDLPCEVRVAPNRTHTIVARRQGYESAELHVPARSDLASSIELVVKLKPLSATPVQRGPAAAKNPSDVPPLFEPPQSAESGRTKITWKDLTLAGGLIVGGSLIAINPLRTIVQDGDPVDGKAGYRVSAGARTKALLVLGSAMVVTGAVVVPWWKPFAVRAGFTGDGAAIELDARF